MEDWAPTGPELAAAAEHAARMAGRYHQLGEDWEAEAMRLTDLIMAEGSGVNRTSGIVARIAGLLGIPTITFQWRRAKARESQRAR